MASLKSNGVKKANSVNPIKNKKDLKKIYAYLKETNVRNYCIFVVGINTMLRAGDLMSLKWSDVLDEDDNFKYQITLTEEKTDKQRNIKINNNVRYALGVYKDSLKQLDMNDYIFKSRKGNEPLDVKSVHRIVKTICTKEFRLKGNYGSHTLRKTGAFHMYKDNIADNPMVLSKLQRALGHSSQEITLRYIGIEQEEIDNMYDSMDGLC